MSITPLEMESKCFWNESEPNWAAACGYPDVKLHLYGKLEPRSGRKMGHLTALAADSETALRDVLAAENDSLDDPDEDVRGVCSGADTGARGGRHRRGSAVALQR